MDKISSYKSNNTNFGLRERFDDPNAIAVHHSFIRQQIHDKKIDEFFWTDVNAPPKRKSVLAAIGSVVGVVIPSLLFVKKHKPGLKFSSLQDVKELFKEAFKMDYHLKEVLGVGLGGVIGGLAGGLADKKERNKINKLEEASYQAMNITFPALLVGGIIKLCEKFKPLDKTYIKLLAPVAGIFVGANLAVNLSNKLDDVLFDKYIPDGERKFKKKDLIVHVDDLFASLVLAKVPFADKLHINKILPAIFAWSGYHVGES